MQHMIGRSAQSSACDNLAKHPSPPSVAIRVAAPLIAIPRLLRPLPACVPRWQLPKLGSARGFGEHRHFFPLRTSFVPATAQESRRALALSVEKQKALLSKSSGTESSHNFLLYHLWLLQCTDY